MDLDSVIKNRRSIRSFYNLDISLIDLLKIVESGLYAPSAGDLQPWSFILIKSSEKKEELAKLTGEDWLIGANTIIAVIGNKMNYELYFKEFACELLNQSIAACIQNMLLKATELNISSCWVAGFEKEPINKLLKLPKGKECLALIALGFKAEEPKKKTIKSLFTCVFIEQYGKKDLGEAGFIKEPNEVIEDIIKVFGEPPIKK
ncbi:MAG: nitroreductase family protein [Nanoarchaeota archaeon]